MTSAPKPKIATPLTQPPLRLLRTTVAGQVLDVLREKIVSGAYIEGTPLRQDAIASELGVSRIPLREALRQLQAEGLVTFSPHVGAVVSTLSIPEIEELFDLRALLEADLLRRSIPLTTRAHIERADEVLAAYEAAFARRDVAAWGALNWQFHSTLLAPANRPLTLRVLKNIHYQTDRYIRMQIALTHGESRAHKEHRAIAEAARQKQTERACQLVSAHIVSAGQRLTDFLRQHRARGGKSSRS